MKGQNSYPTTRPPRLSEWLLGKILPEDYREDVTGDLCEEFRRRVRQRGPGSARRWYRLQFICFLTALLGQHISRPHRLRQQTENQQRTAAPEVEMRQRIFDILRNGLRALWRSPGFSLAAILTLGLGIGANSLLFSIVNSILIQPLAYRDADRLVVIREIIPQVADRYPTLPVNAGHFERWREKADSLEDAAAVGSMNLNLTGAGEPRRLQASRVSWNLFSMLGLPIQLGRSFRPEEDVHGKNRVAILSNSLWKNQFHADPNILGRSIQLSGQPYQVVGVLAANVYFPRSGELGDLVDLGKDSDIFVPIGFSENDLEPVGDHNFGAIARLKAGVSLDQATAELNALQTSIASELPVDLDLQVRLIPLQSQLVRNVKSPLWILLAAVAAVLLIGCVNLANLLLARAMARQGEVALRMALGARPGWLVSQFLSETLILSLLGGGLGIALAFSGKNLLLKTVPVDLPHFLAISLDFRVVLFAAALSLVTGLLFGLLPAIRVARINPQRSLNSVGQRGSESRNSLRVRSWLVALEVALSTVLLVVAGLLAGSLFQLSEVDKGFVVDNISSIDLQVAGTYATAKDRIRFYDAVLEKASEIPGVRQAAIVNVLPLTGQSTIDLASLPEDTRPVLERPLANYRWISPDFFDLLGISLVQGRSYTQGDRQSQVALISQGLARELWPEADPIGRNFSRGDGTGSDQFRVIGVVSDIRTTSLWDDPTETVYLPYWEQGPSQVALLIRSQSSRPPSAELRRAIWQIAPDIPVSGLTPLQQIVLGSLEMQRFQAWLVGSFAVVALLLASFGIYAVISQIVGSRTREIGVRMALGAARRDILKLIVRQGMIPSLLGLAAGCMGAFLVSRGIGHLLFGVSAGDLPTFGLATAILFLVALGACYLPARRASRFDPMRILRQ